MLTDTNNEDERIIKGLKEGEWDGCTTDGILFVLPTSANWSQIKNMSSASAVFITNFGDLQLLRKSTNPPSSGKNFCSLNRVSIPGAGWRPVLTMTTTILFFTGASNFLTYIKWSVELKWVELFCCFKEPSDGTSRFKTLTSSSATYKFPSFPRQHFACSAICSARGIFASATGLKYRGCRVILTLSTCLYCNCVLVVLHLLLLLWHVCMNEMSENF